MMPQEKDDPLDRPSLEIKPDPPHDLQPDEPSGRQNNRRVEPLPVPPNLQLLFLDFLENQPETSGTLREFSQKTGIPETQASEIAERLWFDGMICRGGKPRPWGKAPKEDPFTTPLALTPYALEIMNDPEGPEKWVSGRIFDPYRPQSRLQAALTGTIGIPVSRAFLIAVLSVFLLGLFYCSVSWNTFVNYLKPDESDPIVAGVFSHLGLETGSIWVDGHWWIPLQANLVHLGLLHLVMNSLVLWRLGGHVERVYGSLPYFFICLGSAWLGGCAALAWNPFGGAGASAALSGVIAADGVWFLLNRKVLSSRLHYLWGQQVTINLGFLLAISFMARVSASGHFGGAIAGALLSWSWLGFSNKKQQFSVRVARTLGMLVAVAAGGFFLVEKARTDWVIWDVYREVEYFEPMAERLKDDLLNPLFQLENVEIFPLMKIHPSLRDLDKVTEVVGKLTRFEALSRDQRQEWKTVEHSRRQEKPERIQSLFDAIDEYIEENKNYIDSGLRLDEGTKKKLSQSLDRLKVEIKPYFGFKENPALDRKEK